jgi:hypothetical protein
VPLFARAQATVRPATPEDAPGVAAVLAAAYDPPPLDAAQFAVSLQTGQAFWVAEADGRVCGVVRHQEREGIAWFDLLSASRPGAGAALVHAVESSAQDRGLRLVRTRVPDSEPLPTYFARRGYLPIAREVSNGETVLLMERRLPLLTVREQRRDDAQVLAALTGGHAWDFERAVRPGWFVLADGERIGGYLFVTDAGGGAGQISAPVLLDAYCGRRLELWMIERAAMWAETNGYHRVEVEASPTLDALKPELEERAWLREGAPDGGTWQRRFRDLPQPGEDEADEW